MRTIVPTLAALCMVASAGASRAGSAPLDIGAAMPTVSAKDDAGADIDLASVAAGGWTLVYFYPKADTPGCTAQGCSLRDAWSDLGGKGIRVYGVSGDSVDAQRRFRQKYQFPFPLLSDPEGKVMDAFGVPRSWKIAARQAYLFRDGKLVWRALKASTSGQARDVLAAQAAVSGGGAK